MAGSDSPDAKNAPEVILHIERLVAGRTDRRPLVLLHGFTGDTTTWSRLTPHLGSTRDVWALDLVGHGRSPDPDHPAAYRMSRVVAAVLETTDRAGLARPAWLGYSMGGRVALHLALAAPTRVAALALVGASPGIADPARRRQRVRDDEALAAFIEREGLAAFVDRWMAHPLFSTQARLGEDYLAAARAQRMRNRPAALARVLREMGTGAMRPVADRLDRIDVPALLVAGAEDEKFRRLASEMAARMPQASVRIIERAGHAVHVEAPEALGTAVAAFLRQAEA